MIKLTFLQKMVFTAVLIALTVIVELLHFPLIPSAPFLEYDGAGIVILVISVIVGPVWGLGAGVIVPFLHIVFGGNAGIYGAIMNSAGLIAFGVVGSLLFYFMNKKELTTRTKNITLVISLILGIVALTAVMIPLNLIVTPAFMGVPVSVVVDMIIPILVPFNLIKGGINAVAGFIVLLLLFKSRRF